jgi:hypothetical protein
MGTEILRTLSLCIALAGIETLHGVFRATVLVPRIGKKQALRLSIITGSGLAFGICFLLVPDIGVVEPAGLFVIGLALSLFMASFDIALGKMLLKLSWSKIIQDFDPRTGNYLSLGLLLLIVFPYAVMKIR